MPTFVIDAEGWTEEDKWGFTFKELYDHIKATAKKAGRGSEFNRLIVGKGETLDEAFGRLKKNIDIMDVNFHGYLDDPDWFRVNGDPVSGTDFCLAIINNGVHVETVILRSCNESPTAFESRFRNYGWDEVNFELPGIIPGTTTKEGGVSPHGSLDWKGSGQGHSLYMYYKKRGYFISEEELAELRLRLLQNIPF
jgi:hypothetical protein